jgi:cysteine-rich repeat protein
MRRSAIVCLTTLVGCSFIDDFDKFGPRSDTGDDAGSPEPVPDAGDGLDAATPQDAAPPVDTGRPGPVPDAASEASVADAAGAQDTGVPVVDAGQPDTGAQGVCGDGVVDTARGEVCDDGNQLAGDGCEPVTCTMTPQPTCAGVLCNDRNPCTVDQCDPITGCSFTAIDADRDGFSPGQCGQGNPNLRGGDCNDGNELVYPGAVETCDGIDNDCDPMRAIDEGLPKLRCYPDLDGDGYANLDGAGTMSCACPPGRIAVDDPRDRSRHDCYDDAVDGADVHPGQTTGFERGYGRSGRRSFDYDCDGAEEALYEALPAGGCQGLLVLCVGATGFEAPLPVCGESGRFSVCTELDLGCAGTSETRKQLCL